MRYLSATKIYPVTQPPLENGVLGIEDNGTIVEILSKEAAKSRHLKDITHYKGLLVPGFVNTHCHLELSHLRGEIDVHTGLVDFVQAVMKLRTSDEYALEVAMLKADLAMFENGIVAVGDISNQVISKSIKNGSPVYYHTFLEIMGFNPDSAKQSINRAIEFEEKFEGMPVSIVPHAPYSVSAALFNELRLNEEGNEALVSIHNQETADENAFFQNKTGKLLDLFKFLGLDISFYEASGKTSLQTFLPLLSPDLKTLLVHNTYTSREDVEFAESVHPNLYWCLCPRANLYIENRLPDVKMFRDLGLKITLGTDSLASNRYLSIFAEMQILQERFDIPVEELLKWGIWNGAEFLGITERYGSFEVGKRPGINLIDFKEHQGNLVLGDWMKRLY